MAAAETARLIASLELQDKNFTRGIRNVERGIGRVDRKLGAFSGFLNRNVGRALDSIAARGVDALAGTIEQASNLNEEITKSQAVFGKASKEIIAFSETTAAALGISQTEALAAAGNFGNMFKTIGLAEKPAADMSKRFVQLAADMASFNNESPEEMLMKLRSGLAGEAEPLRRYGVLLSEAAVKEEAYASGLAKKGAKLTEGQKVQARYNLILKQTAVQQGDVEKTGGNLAGQQRKLNALMADAGATIGTQLLPVVTELTAAFVDLLKDPGTQAGIKSFAKDLGEGAKGLVASLKTVDWKGFANALGTAAGFAKDLVTAFLGLPSWVQAAVVTGWGLNKITGGLIGDLASGLIKGVLGINAGVVNVNGPVAGMGGAGAAGAAGGGGIASRLGRGIKILGSVTIAGASIIALAETFKGFQETVTASQTDLLEKVNATSKQGFDETIANLKGTAENLAGLQGLDRLLAEGFGGSEIAKNFEMAAGRITTELAAGNLTQDEIATAIKALKSAQEQADSLNLETPELNAAIATLIAALKHPPKPSERPATPRISGVGDRPSPGNPGEFRKNLDKIGFDKWVAKAGEIKTAITTESGAQKAELANIKNATATLNTSTTTGLSTVSAGIGTASVAAGSAASNIANTAGRGLSNTTSAARQAGFTASAAMSNAATRIVGAVNALDLSVNVTTVNRTSTVNNRYGPSGGSSTTQRAGGNTG